MKGFLDGQRRDRARDLQLAQLIGLAVNNPAKLPKLETLMGEKKRRPKHDPEGLHAMLFALSKKGK